jgi:hypothetical protein
LRCHKKSCVTTHLLKMKLALGVVLAVSFEQQESNNPSFSLLFPPSCICIIQAIQR